MKGYIDNYEDLRTWVESTKQPLWNLYSGWIDKFGQSHLLAKNEEETDPEESFNSLRRMIEINSPQGGQFTVYIPQPGNRGFSTRIRIASAASVAGVAGVGNPYMMGMVPMNELEQRIRKERETWELQRRIDDLEAAQESSVGVIGKVMDKITSELDINNLLKFAVAILGPRMNVNPDMLRAVQLSGTPVAEAEDTHDGTGYTYDDPRLLEFLDTIRSQFGTDEEFYNFLTKVGAFFQKNPQIAIGFFAGQNRNE